MSYARRRPGRRTAVSPGNVHLEAARAALAAWQCGEATPAPISHVFESHIFCEPLDPDAATKQRFVEACDRVGVKALCLGLDYRDRGVVRVLQTSKYTEGESPVEPVEAMLRDAEALAEAFSVVRLKLEAMASDPGVPRRDDEVQGLVETTGFDHYFEFHLKFGGPVTCEGDERLKALARSLTDELGIKIPFSCNDMGSKNQRFLNVRTYGVGMEAAQRVVDRVVEAAAAQGFATEKRIEEFIVFDTNKELDRGWLEF